MVCVSACGVCTCVRVEAKVGRSTVFVTFLSLLIALGLCGRGVGITISKIR